MISRNANDHFPGSRIYFQINSLSIGKYHLSYKIFLKYDRYTYFVINHLFRKTRILAKFYIYFNSKI